MTTQHLSPLTMLLSRHTRRREFITRSAAVQWHGRSRRGRSRRSGRGAGVLIVYPQADRESQVRIAAFLDTLQRLGWTDGRNVRVDYRWSVSDPAREKAAAAELVRSIPDVIVTSGPTMLAEVQRLTSTIPIVFTQVSDPLGTGFVTSLA